VVLKPKTTDANVYKKMHEFGAGKYYKWIVGFNLRKNILESTSFLLLFGVSQQNQW
jgi:hypothetical protein